MRCSQKKFEETAMSARFPQSPVLVKNPAIADRQVQIEYSPDGSRRLHHGSKTSPSTVTATCFSAGR
jgi:hypothetical protein